MLKESPNKGGIGTVPAKLQCRIVAAEVAMVVARCCRLLLSLKLQTA